jgi:hypothetical protein
MDAWWYRGAPWGNLMYHISQWPLRGSVTSRSLHTLKLEAPVLAVLHWMLNASVRTLQMSCVTQAPPVAGS